MGSVFVTFASRSDAEEVLRNRHHQLIFKGKKLKAKWQREFNQDKAEFNDEFDADNIERTIYVSGFDKLVRLLNHGLYAKTGGKIAPFLILILLAGNYKGGIASLLPAFPGPHCITKKSFSFWQQRQRMAVYRWRICHLRHSRQCQGVYRSIWR